MRNKNSVLRQLVALCNELEVLPGDAARWILVDLLDGNVDSLTLLQLSALVGEEFGVAISREEFVASARTLEKIADRIASAV